MSQADKCMQANFDPVRSAVQCALYRQRPFGPQLLAERDWHARQRLRRGAHQLAQRAVGRGDERLGVAAVDARDGRQHLHAHCRPHGEEAERLWRGRLLAAVSWCRLSRWRILLCAQDLTPVRSDHWEDPCRIAFSAAVAVPEKPRGFHSGSPQVVGSRSSSFVSARVSSATHQPNFTPLAMTPS